MNHRYIDFVPNSQPKEEIPEEKPVIHISFVDLDAEPEQDEIYEDEVISEQPIIIEEVTEEVVLEPEEEESYEEPEEAYESEETYEPEETYESEETYEDESEFDLETPIEDLMAPKEENFDFGVVEDYVPVNEKKPAFISAPTFTNTKVEKRPLYDKKTDIEKIKSENLLKKAPVEEPKEEKKPETSFKTPKSPFINTNLVEKRPLSKTNYRDRAPIAEKEEESGPVTIIDNQEKGGHLGLIITIVLTIILGAAVGTIAFLLMPR
ncbi:MAG: hypothetical protein MJZ22_02505 [Candidatus Saccharibacteria bacterium]|nr:hypothetical protein [Candidatus Saccharibacteria bacterium]